jgi:dTDP-4-amino-4,6-dideoxygalactose transaminase
MCLGSGRDPRDAARVPPARGYTGRPAAQRVYRLDRRIRASLSAAGIASEVYFPQPLHLTEPCKFLGYRAGQFPAAESASRRLLALPMYPELSAGQVERVCAAVAQAVRAA